MFTTTSIYFLMLFLIFWCYSGYILLLFIIDTLFNRGSGNNTAQINHQKLAVIVPCYNEEEFVRSKIENLKSLIYPQDRLDVFILNGTCTDNTSHEVLDSISQLPNYHLVETGEKGKINQINSWLEISRRDYDIIVSTDMDAILCDDILLKFVREFESDERVAVVGANISPRNCIKLEKDYWEDQNLMRMMESNVYSSSIVVAPCYAYKSFLIDRFPADCVADDIYAAFKANTDGYLTRYVESAKGFELRTPGNFEDYFRHKFRKGNAYLIETLRFLYRLPHMSSWWKVIYLTKFLQLIVLPWILPYFVLSSISLALSGPGYLQITVFAFIFLSVSIAATSLILRHMRFRFFNSKSSAHRSVLMVFILNNLILILIGLSYPFFRQNSTYTKIAVKQV